MARYPNGRIPKSELVTLGTEHFATPATAQRLANLIADVLANEGIRLRVTGGPNIYRDLAWQQFYWDVTPYPNAAYPGTSSHGGVFRGVDCLAVDIDNWAQLGKAKFYSYARKHGFTVDVFSWEPWHIIDYNPWVMPGGSGGGSSKPTPTPEEEEEEMKSSYIWWLTTNNLQMNLVYPISGNGLYDLWESSNGVYNTGVVQQYDLAGPGFKISQGHGEAIVARCEKKLAAK